MAFLDGSIRSGRLFAAASTAQFQRVLDETCVDNDVGPGERAALFMTAGFLADWCSSGAQVYELDHSIAALLAATRAPAIDWERTPHRFMVLKVPRLFVPVRGDGADVWIAVSASGKVMGVFETCERIHWLFVNEPLHEDLSDEIEAVDDLHAEPHAEPHAVDAGGWRMAIRMVANVIAYVTQHRECVGSPSGQANGRSTSRVSAPRDVVVDKAFRDRISALVSAGSLREIRSALAHMVRGHWRNQPVGVGLADRRLTWVRPHRRGDESLGSVVSRIERMQA